MSSFAELLIVHGSLLVAILLFALGLWVYFDRRTDSTRLTFGVFLIVAALWSFSTVLFREAETAFQVLFWIRTVHAISAFVPAAFLLLAFASSRGRMPRTSAQILVIVPLSALAAAAYVGGFSVAPDPSGSGFVFGPWRSAFAAAYIPLIPAAFLLVRCGRSAARASAATFLAGGAIASGGLAAAMFAFGPAAAAQALLLGNIGLAVGAAAMAFAVLDRSFLAHIRLNGTELFLLLIVFAIVTDVAVSESMLDFTFRFTLLVILVCYGAIATRRFVEEIRRAREIEELNAQVMKMNGHLIEADKMKTRFISFASHQLRSPVAGVRAYLQMVRDGAFGPVSSRQSAIMETNIEVLRNLLETTESFLDLSKIHSGHFDLYRKEMDVRILVDRVVEEMTAVASRKGIALHGRVPHGLPPVIADEGKLFHALLNLVDNAIKYTESGGATVEASYADGQLTVSVTDTGIGLTKEERDRVFGLFERGLDAVRLDSGGSGLGLFIMKNIVEGHGGSVFASSEGRDRGATFGFRIPVR